MPRRRRTIKRKLTTEFVVKAPLPPRGGQAPLLSPKSYAVKLGARMRDLRLERGLSLTSLGAEGGLAPSQMSSAERGEVQITIGTVAAVARALGIPVFYLMAFPDEDPLSAVIEEIRLVYGKSLDHMALGIAERAAKLTAKKRKRQKKK